MEATNHLHSAGVPTTGKWRHSLQRTPPNNSYRVGIRRTAHMLRSLMLRQVESYIGYGRGSLASAWAMVRYRQKEYRRKLDAATRCSGVCPVPDLTLADREWKFPSLWLWIVGHITFFPKYLQTAKNSFNFAMLWIANARSLLVHFHFWKITSIYDRWKSRRGWPGSSLNPCLSGPGK